MLKKSRDQHRLTVRHRININLDPFQEAVDAQRTCRSDLADSFKLARQIVWRVGEVNREPADHV